MRHIKLFPYPNTPEHLADRASLLTKIMAGVLVQELQPLPATWDELPEWMLHPCWLHAAKWEDRNGHKKLRYKGDIFFIHRVMCELVNGPIPEGYVVDHLCKVHGCCQPRHLEAVPTKVNTLRGDNPNWMMRQAVKEALFHEHYTIEGKLGDVDVKLETPRPEFWTTPDLLQAHIDHGHPRFRKPLMVTPWREVEPRPGYQPQSERLAIYDTPLDHQRGGLDFLGYNECLDPDIVPHPFGARSDGSWRGLHLTDIPADHVVVSGRVSETNRQTREPDLVDEISKILKEVGFVEPGPGVSLVPSVEFIERLKEVSIPRWYARAWRWLFPKSAPGSRTTRSVGEL